MKRMEGLTPAAVEAGGEGRATEELLVVGISLCEERVVRVGGMVGGVLDY